MPSINLTGLEANLKDYAQTPNNRLFSEPLLGLDKTFQEQGVTLWTNVLDETPMISASTGSIIQPGNDKVFNGTDDAVKFRNRTLKVERWKADIMIYPQDYEKNWLSANLMGEARAKAAFKDWTDIPLATFIMDQMKNKIADQLREVTWNGIKVGSPSTSYDWMDGFKQRIKVGRVAGDIPVITLGAITAANVIQKLELIGDAVSKAYARVPGFLHVPDAVYKLYCKADPTLVGRQQQFSDTPGADEVIYLRSSKIKLVRNYELNYGATSQIFFTTENNLFVGTDDMMRNAEVDFQKFDRGIKMLIDGRWTANYAMDKKGISETPIICSEAFV